MVFKAHPPSCDPTTLKLNVGNASSEAEGQFTLLPQILKYASNL